MRRQPQGLIIYRVFNLINGKCYVGQTRIALMDRIDGHRGDSRRNIKWKSLLARAIIKYGWENFRVDVIEACLTLEHLDTREQFWIKEMDSLAPHGYNIALGGCVNRLVSEETRRKISLAQTGKKRGPMPQSVRDKIGAGNRGLKKPSPSLETRAAAKMRGRKMPESWHIRMKEWRLQNGGGPTKGKQWSAKRRNGHISAFGELSSSYGLKRSPEVIAKLKATWTPEKRATFSKMMSERRKTMVYTAESRSKISAALKGRVFTAEHCAKISAAKKGVKTT